MRQNLDSCLIFFIVKYVKIASIQACSKHLAGECSDLLRSILTDFCRTLKEFHALYAPNFCHDFHVSLVCSYLPRNLCMVLLGRNASWSIAFGLSEAKRYLRCI